MLVIHGPSKPNRSNRGKTNHQRAGKPRYRLSWFDGVKFIEQRNVREDQMTPQLIQDFVNKHLEQPIVVSNVDSLPAWML